MCIRLCNVALDFVRRHPVLEKSPLTLVICQMRFPRQMGLSESDVRPLQRAVADRYPVAQTGRAANLMLGPQGVSEASAPEPIFQFRSDDQAWTLTVAPDSVSLETTAYDDFSDFLDRWVEITTAVQSALDLTRQNRIGLRYVDELECPVRPTPEDLSRLLREELVGVVGKHPRTSALLGSMQELRFGLQRGANTLRHGLVARPDGRVAYVLDFDFYDDTPQPLDLDRQQRLLADFNDGAFELFRWSVNDAYFATFDPREQDDDDS